MNIYNFIDENSATVKGPEGPDKVPAKVPAGSFVVPVNLTNGEKVIPPEKVPIVDQAVKEAGGGGIQDLAPNGKTESELRTVGVQSIPEPEFIIQIVRVPNKSAYGELTGKTHEERRKVRNPHYKSPEQVAQGYATGGFVNPNGELVDENGNIIPLEPKPIQPVVDAAGSQQIIADNAQQAAIGQAENNAVWNNTIPEDQGIEEQRSKLEKIYDLIGKSTPKMDELKADRLKKVAAVNSVGQLFSTAVSGIAGAKGGPILNTNTDITPKALAEYNAMIKEDKDNKYRTALAKANAGITSMREEQVIRLANKRYNQQLMSDWNKLKAKITLEDIQDRNKLAMKYREMAARFGYDVKLDGIQTENDLKKDNQNFEQQMKLYQYTQGQANYRARLAAEGKENKNVVTFKNGKEDDELDVDSAIEFANAALAEKQDKYSESYDLLKQKADVDYQLLQKAASNGYNVGELKAIISRLYPKYRDKYGIYSKNDKGRIAPDIVPADDPLGIINGEAQVVAPDKAQSTNTTDPYDKYKRK